MKRTQLLLLLALVLVPACVTEASGPVPLLPQAEHVEFAMDTPSKDAYALVGELRGEASDKDPDAARAFARNDLRNKAAALGATFVTADEETGERLFMQNKTKAVVRGRAYKPVD